MAVRPVRALERQGLLSLWETVFGDGAGFVNSFLDGTGVEIGGFAAVENGVTAAAAYTAGGISVGGVPYPYIYAVSTLPEFRVVAAAGSYLQVSLPSAGKGIRVDYDFTGGEAVVIDCQGETVLINDVDSRDCVALASDFFALEPGECIVSTSNCTYVETRFSERWA